MSGDSLLCDALSEEVDAKKLALDEIDNHGGISGKEEIE